jgi:hypothetical protein
MNVKGVAFGVSKTGTPTGNLRVRVYTDSGGTSTLVATSDVAIAPANVLTGSYWTNFLFSSPVTFVGGTVYRVVLSESTQSDSSSNFYNYFFITVDSDANSLTLLPFGGTLTAAYCLATCTTTSNWVTTYDVPLFALLLDPTGEFSSSGGGQKGYPWVH